MTNLDKCGNVIKIQNLGQMRKLGQLSVSIQSLLILPQMENGKDIFDKCSIMNNLHILGTRKRLLLITVGNGTAERSQYGSRRNSKMNWTFEGVILLLSYNRIFPEWRQLFVEFSEFTESDKSLKDELGSVSRLCLLPVTE